MEIAKSFLRIVLLLAFVLVLVIAVILYQPVRHVIYNNTGSQIYALQEHYGSKMSASSSGDVNGLFETPLSNRFVFGDLQSGQRGINVIRFGSDGNLNVFNRMGGANSSINLPDSLASNWLLWRQFTYQLDADGKLYLLGPGEEPPINTVAPQRAGFPISLFVEHDTTWPALHIEGATLELIDDRRIEQYKFAKGGYAITSLGQKGGAVTPPVFYWRLENGSLIITEDTQGKVFTELLSPKILGNVIRVERRSGGSASFRISKPEAQGRAG